MTNIHSSQHSNITMSYFFQAEDGIRYLTVTGVQTCALPILVRRPARHQPRSLSRASVLSAPGHQARSLPALAAGGRVHREPGGPAGHDRLRDLLGDRPPVDRKSVV